MNCLRCGLKQPPLMPHTAPDACIRALRTELGAARTGAENLKKMSRLLWLIVFRLPDHWTSVTVEEAGEHDPSKMGLNCDLIGDRIIIKAFERGQDAAKD